MYEMNLSISFAITLDFAASWEVKYVQMATILNKQADTVFGSVNGLFQWNLSFDHQIPIVAIWTDFTRQKATKSRIIANVIIKFI